MNTNSLIKLISVLLLAALGVWLVYVLVLGGGMGYGYHMAGSYRGGSFNMGLGYGYGSSLSYLLLLVIKVLFGVFLVALAAGVIVWIKNNLFTEADIATIKNTFSGNNAVNPKSSCDSCGKTVEAEWKLCPYCGKEKDA